MLDMTYEQAVERIDDHLRQAFPKEVRTREICCVVVHRFDGDERYTFVEARCFTTRGVYGKRRAERYRFGSLMTLPFAYFDEDMTHEAGRCNVCTIRYRLLQGLGLDVRDLPFQIGYMPASEVEATRRWTKDEIAKVPAADKGLMFFGDRVRGDLDKRAQQEQEPTS